MTLTVDRVDYSAPNTPAQREVSIDQIEASALNPRRRFDEDALQELAESIKTHGLLEPIVVRRLSPPAVDEERLARGYKTFVLHPVQVDEAVRQDVQRAIDSPSGHGECRFGKLPHEWDDAVAIYHQIAARLGFRLYDIRLIDQVGHRWGFRLVPLDEPRFSIIAGERRWRAAKLAGLESVPIRDLGEISDAEALQLAIVENLQRQDLDPIEEAEAYAALNRVAGLKQAQIAAAVKRSQPVVANRMRLLELPEDVRERIRKGELTPAHGIALARFAQFPAIVSEMARLAVEHKATSADLEHKVPFADTLSFDKALIARVDGRSFEESTCRNCPFGAYRSTGTERWANGYCFRPEHLRELDEQVMDAFVAQQKAQRAATAAAQPTNETAAETPVPTRDDRLPDVKNLPYGSWERVDSYKPSECTAKCPCRAAGVEYGRPITICTDPARFKRLQRAETIAKNKARRADADAKLKRVALLMVDPNAAVTIAEIAVVSQIALTGGVGASAYTVSVKFREVMKTRGKQEWAPALSVKELAHLGPSPLVWTILEATLRAELAAYRDGMVGTASITDWYLAQRGEAS